MTNQRRLYNFLALFFSWKLVLRKKSYHFVSLNHEALIEQVLLRGAMGSWKFKKLSNNFKKERSDDVIKEDQILISLKGNFDQPETKE